MPVPSLPTVGFDRFVRLEWANYALTLAMMDKSPHELRTWLNERISGKDSARKTMNVLANLWFTEYEQTHSLREQGLKYARSEMEISPIIFHWGMCLANFPLFWQTASTIGRLTRLQTTFHKTEIKARIGELYPNQVTVNRSVERILQSLEEWNVLHTLENGRIEANEKIVIKNTSVIAWLFMAALKTSQTHPINVVDFVLSPVFFPFDLGEHGLEVLRNSDEFILIREGVEKELVRLAVDKHTRLYTYSQ